MYEGIRIAHVSSVHPWTDNRIHYREAQSLADAGYQVTLVAVESQVDGPVNSVNIVTLPVLPRLRRMTFGSIRAIREAVRTGAMIYHLHDPELVWAVPLLRICGKRVIYDAHEDLPVQVLSKPYMSSWLRFPAVVVANLVVRLACLSNHVVAATEKIAERFPSGKVTVVHNYPPLRDEENDALPLMDRPETTVYIGGISEQRGANVMIAAMAEPILDDAWRLRMAGPIGTSLLTELQHAPGWNKVAFAGQVAPDEARDLLLRSRVGLLLLQDTEAYRDSLPTKMFEYFAAGLPVIASDFPLWRSLVESNDVGTVVDQTDPTAIARALQRYRNDLELLERQGQLARELARTNFNWSHEARNLVDVYHAVEGSR